MNECDGIRGRMQFALEGLSWLIEDVAKENLGSSIMKESDEDRADAYGALIRSDLDRKCTYMSDL
jgi:hypothetical protein